MVGFVPPVCLTRCTPLSLSVFILALLTSSQIIFTLIEYVFTMRLFNYEFNIKQSISLCRSTAQIREDYRAKSLNESDPQVTVF